MPIRFRCAYCNQLLGIARRKAGQVVRCPTCAGQVVVPTSEEVEHAAAGGESQAASGPDGDAPVFERSDFDQIFNIPSEPQAAPTGRATAATGPAAADFPRYDVEPVPPAAVPPPPPPSLPDPVLPPGILLSPKKATVLTVLWIVSAAAFFLIGLFVGLSIH
jgi:hypothetical protein